MSASAFSSFARLTRSQGRHYTRLYTHVARALD